MDYNFRQDGAWDQGTPKKRKNGEWAAINDPIGDGDGTNGGGTGSLDGGFDWDQTFTDTDWLYDADESDNLNVETVTTLDYDGDGGIREAVDNASNEPTIIVFEVGGQITIEESDDRFRIDSPEIWFAGETAPHPGITFSEGRVRTEEPDLIFSHITFAAGDRGVSEAKTSFTAEEPDTLMDHCTFALSASTNTSWHRGADRASVINCIIAEGLYRHGFHDTARARGLLVLAEDEEDGENDDMTHLGCLYAHNVRRQPLMRANCCMANNYVYNYAHNVDGYTGSGSSGNLINFNSPADPEITAKSILFEEGDGTPDDYDREIFNYTADALFADDIERPDRHPLTDGQPTMVDDPPLVPPGLDLDTDLVSTSELKSEVTANVGPRPADRPDYEDELIENRLESGANVIDSVDDLEDDDWTTPWDYDQTSHTLDVPSTDIVDWVKGYTDKVELET